MTLQSHVEIFCRKCKHVNHVFREILLFLQPLCLVDLVAQLVEHNTFNVGALGSNPSGITLPSRFSFSSVPDYTNCNKSFQCID